MLTLQVQASSAVQELQNVPDMERKVAKGQHGFSHVQLEKHLLQRWAKDVNLTRYRWKFRTIPGPLQTAVHILNSLSSEDILFRN